MLPFKKNCSTQHLKFVTWTGVRHEGSNISMEETGGDDMEDDETFTSPFSSNEISKEERQLKAKTIFQREFDKQLDGLEKQIMRHESSITLVKKYLNIVRCHLLLTEGGKDKFIFGAGAYPYINTRKRAEKQNEKSRTNSTGIQPKHSPHMKVENSCKNNNRALQSEVKSSLFKNNNRIPKELHDESECHIRGKRFKKLQRFVVGNVSQWCPERQYQVSAPYKWMLYVRGPREDPEISKYVTKVSVFLDPSYYPNNVVHIIEPPFHLVRRGWGEFLVRIVIFFYLSRNKPLTIYHRLQLDRTRSGYQSCAPETIADYWIYTDIPRNTVNVDGVVSLDYKEENMTTEENREDRSKPLELSSEESDHYLKKDGESNGSMRRTKRMSVIDLTRLVGDIVTEHNYSSLHNLDQRFRSKPSQQVPLPILIEGKSGVSLLKPSSKQGASGIQPKKRCIMTNRIHKAEHDKLFRIWSKPSEQLSLPILIEGKSGVSLLKPSSERGASSVQPKKRRIMKNRKHKVEHDKLFRIAAEKSNTLPYHQAVSFLLHRLPMVTNMAGSDDYLRFHPYAAISVDQYHSWSTAKQCAAQYYRSKKIKDILLGRDSSDESWTCKDIMIYARRHGYVPCPKIQLVQDGPVERDVKISAHDSKDYKLSRRRKTFLRVNAEKDSSALINSKCGHGTKVKKNKISFDKDKRSTNTDVKNIAVTEATRRETSSVNKHYAPLARQKSNPPLESMTKKNKIFKADTTKMSKNKKKRSESQIIKGNVQRNFRKLCMKPTLCEPKRILEFIYANDPEDESWNDDPRDVDILSVYDTVDLGDTLNEDTLEVSEDHAQLCHFIRKSFKWLSFGHGPKPNQYTVPEILVAIAAELFMEDVFRRTLNEAWCHYDPKGKTPITIYLKDALVALRRRKQFDIFNNCGLGVICDTREVDK